MTDKTKISQSLDYIEVNLKGELSLDDLSGRAYLSKYHFHRLFHAITGDSVKRYINKRRMAEAARELVLSQTRILDIALRYQYGSQEAFTRAFKRVYGMPPGEYRRQYATIPVQRAGRSGGTTCRAA